MTAEIRRVRPDIVFTGLPTARTAYWLADAPPGLGAALATGVSGGFDVDAGRLQRAPASRQCVDPGTTA